MFGIFITIFHIPKWILLVFSMVFLNIPLMATLNIWYSDPQNFLNEIIKKSRKEEHKKRFSGKSVYV